jgi:hypothetical protein
MILDEFISAVRDWLGDAEDHIIGDNQIMFFVLSSLDFYAAQIYNAGKGRVEYKVTKTPATKETTVSETFAFGQVGYVRRRIYDGVASDLWEDLDVCDKISDLNDAELAGRLAVYFVGHSPMTMILSWNPDSTETLELWGEKLMFSDLEETSDEVADIPALFQHLVIEGAAKKAINLLLRTAPALAEFVRAQKAELNESIQRREIIWRNYLAGTIDKRRTHEIEAYSPLRDPVFYE